MIKEVNKNSADKTAVPERAYVRTEFPFNWSKSVYEGESPGNSG